ncbi:MAG TPA: hypothetical protein VEJ84_03545 [Acidimicrobiales bacterium]|nr:hypothetical protein [Acidimicrobiales bacterium]
MTTCPPPYRPLRGADPPHFVDRADEEDMGTSAILASSIAAYRAGPCDPRFHRLVVSHSAMGKTALLRAVGREAAARLDWAVVMHRCRPKERALGAAVGQTLAHMQKQWPMQAGRLAREVSPCCNREPPLFSLTNGVSPVDGGSLAVDVPGPLEREVSRATLRQFLQRAGQFARSISRGLLIMFDDADSLGGGEVESLGHLARSLSRDGLPVAMLFSGGPELRERFARLDNFLGCIWPTSLGWFDGSESREALVVPAADRDVEFQEQALELICSAADGSPLEIQRLGFAAWAAAAGSDVVKVDDVRAALRQLAPELPARAS